MMKMILVMIFIATTSFAGTREGGNGGSHVFVKGKWELSDFYVASVSPGNPVLLSDDMRNYLIAVKDLIAPYLGSNLGIKEFWDNLVLGPRAEYRVVETLPCKDEPLVLSQPLLKQVSYGCTKNGVTYLVASELNKLEFKNRALALIHERLHAMSHKHKHTDIAAFVSSLNTMIQLREEQNEGKYRMLFPGEIETLEKLCDVADKLYLGSSRYFSAQKRVVWPLGGGVVKAPKSSVSSDTFIGVGAEVTIEDSYWTDHHPTISDSKILGGFIYNSSLSKSLAIDSRIYSSELRDSFSLGSVVIDYSSVVESLIEYTFLQRKSTVYKSTVSNSNLAERSYVAGVNMENSSLSTENMSVLDQTIRNCSIRKNDQNRVEYKDRGFSLCQRW